MEQSKIRSVSPIRLFQSRKWLDETAFEHAFSEHYERVYAVVFRLTGDRYEADDLAAETFWKLWSHPPAEDSNLGGWLYRVATHLGYNALRSAKRRAEHETQASAALDWSEPSDPANEIEKSLERERVRAVLRQMPFRDIQILVLRHSGFSYQEIASAAGIAAASVGKLLARAEEKFEKMYSRGDRHAPDRG